MTLLPVKLPTNVESKRTGAFDFPSGERVKKTSLLLNGFGLALRSDFTWGYTSGVFPQQASFQMQMLQVNQLFEKIGQSGAVTINIETNDLDNKAIKETFTGLSMLPRSPGTHTHDTVTVVDDRWRWANKSVYRTYNLVRKVNDEQVLGKTFVGGAVTLTKAVKYYVPWTIKKGKPGTSDPKTKKENPGTQDAPWSALDIVVDILVNYLGYSEEAINITEAQKSMYIPPNIVLVGVKAHSVIARFLDESDNSLYIDKNGKVVIYANKIPYGQSEFDKHLKPALAGRVGGAMWVQDRKAICPTDIFHSFEKEFECLLTYREREGTATTVGNEAPAKTEEDALKQIKERQIFVENVTNTVVDNQVRNLPAGSIVTIEEALEAFGQKFGGAAITLAELREKYGIAAKTPFGTVLKRPGTSVFDPVAILAWTAIYRDYRKRFRIPSVVMQFIKAANNVMAEVINVETGKRKPSECFSKISWVVDIAARIVAKREQGIVLDSFDNLLQGGKYSPVPLLPSPVDTETGTYIVEGVEDQNHPGSVTDIIMGRPLDGDRFFQDNFAEGESAHQRDSIIGIHGLEADWELSAIMSITLLPSGPESMYWLNVAPPEGVSAGNGAPVEVHLNYDTARWALDNQALQAYRTGQGDAFLNRELIKAIGKQEAARRWVTFSNQVMGNVTFALSKAAMKLRPQGPISAIQFTVSPGGAVRMQFSAQPISEGRDLQNVLDHELLESVFGQVHFQTRKGTR